MSKKIIPKSLKQEVTIKEYEEFWKKDPSSKQDEEVFRDWTKNFWNSADIAEILKEHSGLENVEFADFGCGRGLSATAFIGLLKRILINPKLKIAYTGIDGWNSADELRKTLSHLNLASINFEKALIYDTSLKPNVFDIATCFGVLHHTDRPAQTLGEIARTLKSGGFIFLHCNAEFPLLRSCNENGFRKFLSDRTGSERDKIIEDLTTLGAAIAQIKEDVVIKSNIDSLGIPSGNYKMIELLNYYIFKLYFNHRLTFDRNVHTNKDWWFPPIVDGFTKDQLIGWLKDSSMQVIYLKSPTPSSYSIVARKS